MRRTISLPVLALVVLLALIGHDAVMAAGPHELEASHHALHGAGDNAPKTNCHVPDGLRPAPPDGPTPDTSSAILIATLMMPLRQEIGHTASGVAPDYPPDVRRAFLQVYLN
jgi:hypothetical protein